MTLPQIKNRPLSRYLKDFKHSQSHCGICQKPLDRITLVWRDEIINKQAIAGMDMLIDEAGWLAMKGDLAALCRFCGDVQCHSQQNFFDVIAFKRYLFEQTDMSHGTIHEYVVRLRRLGNHMEQLNVSRELLTGREVCAVLEEYLPRISTNNYRIALRKYCQFLQHNQPEKRVIPLIPATALSVS